MGTVVQMFSNGVPANALSQIDVPHDGRLVGVEWNLATAPAGADFNIQVQLSFGSIIQQVNDTRSVISSAYFAGDITTSGGLVAFLSTYTKLPDIVVGMGERIFVHAAGTALSFTACLALHFDFELDRAPARRR